MDIIGILIYLVVWGLILYVLWWGVGAIGLPAPFAKVAQVVLVLLTVIILLNLLFGLGGGTTYLPMPRFRS